MSRKAEKVQQEICPALSLSTFGVFLFLSKTVKFPDKENWDFALSFLALLSSCLAGYSFIQTEAFVRSIWGWTDGKYYYSLIFWINTSQAALLDCSSRISCQVVPLLQRSDDCALQHSHLSPLTPQGRTVNSAVKKKNCLAVTRCLTWTGLHSWNQVLCLGELRAEVLSGLLSQKRESNSEIWALLMKQSVQKWNRIEGKQLF